MSPWLEIGVALAVLVGAAVQRWVKVYQRKILRSVSDSKRLRNALSLWEPIVLQNGETMRGVKMFANRARIVCNLADKRRKANGESNSQRVTCIMVGFAALANMGITSVDEIMENDEMFAKMKTQWRAEVSSLFSKYEPEGERARMWRLFEKGFEKATWSHWNEFVKAAMYIEFPRRDAAGCNKGPVGKVSLP